MLSRETERRIAEVLFETATVERQVERSRQVLSSNLYFNPREAFEVAGFGTAKGLQAFLRDEGVSPKLDSLQMLVLQYDSQEEGALTRDDFMQLLLPSEDIALREEALLRNNVFPSALCLPLAEHIFLEASCQEQLAILKKELNMRYDFNFLDAFRAVDQYRLNFVTPIALTEFLRKFGYDLSDQDIDAIIRRIDTDGDTRLSYAEFSEGISTGEQRWMVKSPQKSSKENPVSRSSSVRAKLFTLKDEVLEKAIQAFNTQILIEKEVEEAREDLAEQPDFTTVDLFRALDVDNKGFVTANDIEELLSELQVSFLPDEVYLLVRQYSSVQDSRVRFSDLERMWVPKQYKNAILSRSPLRVPPLYPLEAFSALTVKKIALVFSLLLRAERRAEDIRHSLLDGTNLYDLFQSINLSSDGYISSEEFLRIFRDYGIKLSPRDIEKLVERYDKNMDKRVDYSEFVQELTPKIK